MAGDVSLDVDEVESALAIVVDDASLSLPGTLTLINDDPGTRSVFCYVYQ